MFQRDCAKPPPKILISSVSEDRGTMPRPFRPAAARSWSSEDFLADSPHMEDISSSVVEEPKETASEVLINSTSNSPQLSYSPTGSSALESVNTESVIGDSAISSPDSWVESEFGVMPEKFCESQSDSSLCDSGTAWDVYRATPVEITTLDEGFVPSTEDRVPDEQSTTESFIDEGIYSMSSLESTQERFQGRSVKKQAGIVREKENHNQDMALEQVPDHNEAEIAKEVGSKQMDTSLLQKVEVPREQELPCGLCDAEALASSNIEDLLETEKTTHSQLICNTGLPTPDHFEELIKQTSVEESTYGEQECLKKAVDYIGDAQGHEGQINGQTESQNDRNISEEVEVETECQKTDSFLEETRGKSSDKKDEGVVQIKDKTSEGVLRDCLDPQESFSSVTSDALTNTHPMNQDTASTKSLDPSNGINISLISISSEPEELDEERTCDPDRQDQAEETVRKGSDTDVNSPQNPDKLSCDTSYKNYKKHVEIPSCLVSENVKQTSSEQIRDIESVHLDDTDEHDISRSSDADICWPDTIDNKERSEAKQKCESPQHNSQTGDTEKDLIIQTSSTEAKSQPVKTEQGTDLTDQLDGHQDKLGDSATTQQNTLSPVNSKHSGTTGISCCEVSSVSREIDLFYTDFDRNSPTDDLVGDPVEPMDLFYPDKEEPMFTEPPDTEMQSWPSVLSVSALQPAPATETLQDDQPLNLLGEDFRNGEDSIQDYDKVNVSLFSSASAQSHHLIFK